MTYCCAADLIICVFLSFCFHESIRFIPTRRFGLLGENDNTDKENTIVNTDLHTSYQPNNTLEP